MKARCGRAELLRALAAQGPELLAEAAALSGYEPEAWGGFGAPWPEPGPRLPTEGGEAEGEVAEATADGAVRLSGDGRGGPVTVPAVGRFFQVVAVTHLDTEPHLEPQQRATVRPDAVPWEREARGDVLAFPDPPPLAPWPRLWRRLRPHMSPWLHTREVDVEALLRSVVRAEPLRRLPRLERPRFAAQPLVLVDRSRRLLPFWSDEDAVSAALRRWTVTSHLRPFHFIEGMDPAEWLRAGAVDFGYGLPGTLVLLLGDLGAYGSEGDRASWKAAGEWLSEQGAELRALAPCPAWRLDPGLAALWNAIPWDDSERQLAPLSDQELTERAERLLALVSSALRVELGLLREARSLLSPGATDSGTEADAVQHAAVAGQSAVALTLGREWQAELRKRFDQQEPRSVHQRVAALLTEWHAKLPPEVGWLEHLELALRHPELFKPKEREQLFAHLVEALRAMDVVDARPDGGVPEGVVAWFRDLEGRLPGKAWAEPELREPLLRAWAIAHRDEQEPQQVPPGIDSAALALLGRRAPPSPRRYRFWQVGTGFLVLPVEGTPAGGPPQPRPGGAEAPRGSPVAEFLAGLPRLVVAKRGYPGSAHPIPTPVDQPLSFPVMEPQQSLHLTTDRQQLTLQLFEKPPWATRVGRDAFGLFAEFEFRGVRQRMRRIGPGRFTMGSPANEQGRDADEEQHEVELREGFWMADTACTQELWEAVMGSNPSRFQERAPGEASRPVENVSWKDSQHFLETLNRAVPGLELRLPWEAEWECACRAGTTTPFSFGETITAEQVNYDGNYPYAGGPKGLYRKKTEPVGSLPANAWGLYEMHGNVWEWCQDWYGEYPKGRVVDPEGPMTGTSRVLRGGSWLNVARNSRSAGRFYDEPGVRDGDGGFRLVRGRVRAGEGKASRSEAAERHRGGEGTESNEMPRGRGAAQEQEQGRGGGGLIGSVRRWLGRREKP